MEQQNRISEDDCLASITKSLVKGEGFRHLWVGYTGFGKSVANSILCQYLKDTYQPMTVVIDQKNKHCEYPGEQIVSAGELSKVKSRNVVIRGAAMTRRASDVVVFDDVARDVWTIAQNSDSPICLMPDELMDASTSGQVWKAPIIDGPNGKHKDPWMDKLYRQGRVLGICIGAATQLIQEVPRSVLGMSETKGIFRQLGRELTYLERQGILSEESSKIVSQLEVGEFLYTAHGQPDRVCKFAYDGP